MVLQLQMVKEMKGMAGPNLLTNENAVLAKEKLCRQESTTQWKKWIWDYMQNLNITLGKKTKAKQKFSILVSKLHKNMKPGRKSPSSHVSHADGITA